MKHENHCGFKLVNSLNRFIGAIRVTLVHLTQEMIQGLADRGATDELLKADGWSV